MGRTKRRVRRCRILKVVSADKLNPFASHNWIFGELIHADARRERSVLTTLLTGSTSNAISASLSLACLTFRHTEFIFWHQNDVSSSCHVVFWPRNSNTIFEGKIAQHMIIAYLKVAQLWRLVKSLILTLNISNFAIVYFKRYISKICEKKFRFTGTLTPKCHNIIKYSVNENIKEFDYLLISYWNWNVLHFPHSAFSTLRPFHTPHFPPSVLSSLRTPHSAFSTEPSIIASKGIKCGPSIKRPLRTWPVDRV